MSHHDGDLRDELRRSRFQYWLRTTSAKALAWLQAVVAVGGLVIVLLLQIPWLKKPLEAIGVSESGGIVQLVVLAVLVTLFFDVRALADKVEVATDQRHFSDPIDVYPVLLARMRTISRADEKVLDVLGMTLYTAWPTITFWLNRPEFADWTIRLAAVSCSDKGLGLLVPKEWFKETKSNLNRVLETAKAPAIVRRNIKLEPYGYDFMPALHGFRLGNGDLFYSLLSFQEDGRIGREQYSYEFVRCEDHSPTAQAMRDIFGSWFERARRTPWEAAPRPPGRPEPGLREGTESQPRPDHTAPS
jgi:hypothetical protein